MSWGEIFGRLGDAFRDNGAARAVTAAAVALLVVATGCDTQARRSHRGPVAQSDVRDALFDSVADNLDHLEEFDVNQMMPQICDRLNQWYQQEKPKVNWQLDPLVGELPDDIQKLAVIKTLDLMQYRLPDAWYLQETVWLRDISKLARADQFDDVAVAERLFDWTVRNIQLEPDVDPQVVQANRHRPFETLLFGRGNALERAWIFMLLARQQGLDVVLLGLDDGQGNVRPWLPALLTKDQLYLFDCRLGLPIPGPDGKGVATLAEVAADDALLRRLDLDDDHRYPLTSEQLGQVVALVEATPQGLSRRMALVESRLAGKHKMVLVSPGSALADRAKQVRGVSDAKLWTLPFEIALWQAKLNDRQVKEAGREMALFQLRPMLLAGRALYFKGAYGGDKGAKKHFLNARPADAVIEEYKLPAEMAQRVSKDDIPKLEAIQTFVSRQAKQCASYWLGLVCYEEQDYPVAIDYLAKRTLEAAPDGPWAPGARYNLARTYEAQGKIDQAVALYESDNSAQSHGNKLRARQLKGHQADAKASADATP